MQKEHLSEIRRLKREFHHLENGVTAANPEGYDLETKGSAGTISFERQMRTAHPLLLGHTVDGEVPAIEISSSDIGQVRGRSAPHAPGLVRHFNRIKYITGKDFPHAMAGLVVLLHANPSIDHVETVLERIQDEAAKIIGVAPKKGLTSPMLLQRVYRMDALRSLVMLMAYRRGRVPKEKVKETGVRSVGITYNLRTIDEDKVGGDT